MIKLELFKGIAPKFAPQLLPENGAQVAQNCQFDSGALRPYKGLSTVSGPAMDVNAQSIYLYDKSNPGTDGSWLDGGTGFTTDTDVIRSPVAKDTYGRVYWSNGTQPKMKVSGGSTYDLGIPVPVVTTTTATIDSTDRDPDPPTATDAETRYYVVTYVSAYGEEGPPSSAIALTGGPWYPGDHVDLANLPGSPGGNTNITGKNLYRTNTGSSSTEFQRVNSDVIAIGTTTYADTVPNASLGIVCPSVAWSSPPAALKGLCLHPAGFAVGFKDQTVYCSEMYLPHAWPYTYAVNGEIVGVGIFGNSILVTTKDFPYVLSGMSPDALSVERAEISMACIAKRGMVDMGDFMIYPSVEGLVGVGLSDGAQLLTDGIIDKTSWANYANSNLLGGLWDGKYVGFNGNSAFVFDPDTKDFVIIVPDPSNPTRMPEAVHYEPTAGYLYVKQDTETAIKTFGTGSNLTYTWKSKKFRLDRPRSLGAGQVFADSYSDTKLYVYVDGVTTIKSITLANASAFSAGGWISGATNGGVGYILSKASNTLMVMITKGSFAASENVDDVAVYASSATTVSGTPTDGYYTVSSALPFRMVPVQGTIFEFQFVGTDSINAAFFAETVQQLKEG